MKKLISVFLALILVMGLIPAAVLGVSADDDLSGSCGESAFWSFVPDTGVLTITGTGIVEWQTYQYHYPWNSFSDSVRTIEINDGITEIGPKAFGWMKNLTSVTLPDSLRKIGEYAFWYDSKLTGVILNEGLQLLGKRALDSTDIRQIRIPASLTDLGQTPFYRCENLEMITVAEDNPIYCSDADGVLYNKQKTELLRCPQRYQGSYTIPDTVETLASYAFYQCVGLRSVTLPGSIAELKPYSYGSCTALENVTFSEGLQRIKDNAFTDCESMKQFRFPASLQSLSTGAFGGCGSVEGYFADTGNSVYCSDSAGVLYTKDRTNLLLFPAQFAGAYTVPEGVVSIGWFGQCQKVEEIVLPASFIETESFANKFMGCAGLRRIAAAPENPSFTEYNGAIYNKACTELICCPNGMEGSYEVAPGCKRIGANAFYKCAKLTEVILPEGLEAFGNDALYNCLSLRSIRIPASVTDIPSDSIGYYFEGMRELRGGGDTKIRGFAIYGYQGTAAEAYADRAGFDFYDLDVWEEGKTEFTDVSPDAWYAQPVHWAFQQGIVSGTGSGKFSPGKACTRAEIITMLWRAKGSPEPTTTELPFQDVRPDAWYAKAVAWAVEKGITVGTSQTTFSPHQTCTRAEAITFLWKAVVSNDYELYPAASFQDVSPDAWYAQAVAWAVWYEITAGTSETTFSPKQTCTRAQVVTFFWAVKEGYNFTFGKP